MFEKYNSENGRVFNDGRSKAFFPLTGNPHYMDGQRHGDFWHLPDLTPDEEEFINPFVPLVNPITLYVPVWLRIVATGESFQFVIYNGLTETRTQVEQIPQQVPFIVEIGDTSYTVSDGVDPNEKLISPIVENLSGVQDDGNVTVTDDGIVYKTSIITNAEEYTLQFDNTHDFSVDYESFQPCPRGVLIIPADGSPPFCDCTEQVQGDIVTISSNKWYKYWATRGGQDSCSSWTPGPNNTIPPDDDRLKAYAPADTLAIPITGAERSARELPEPDFIWNEPFLAGFAFRPDVNAASRPNFDYCNGIIEPFTDDPNDNNNIQTTNAGQLVPLFTERLGSFLYTRTGPYDLQDFINEFGGTSDFIDEAIAEGQVQIDVDPFNNPTNPCQNPPPYCRPDYCDPIPVNVRADLILEYRIQNSRFEPRLEDKTLTLPNWLNVTHFGPVSGPTGRTDTGSLTNNQGETNQIFVAELTSLGPFNSNGEQPSQTYDVKDYGEPGFGFPPTPFRPQNNNLLFPDSGEGILSFRFENVTISDPNGRSPSQQNICDNSSQGASYPDCIPPDADPENPEPVGGTVNAQVTVSYADSDNIVDVWESQDSKITFTSDAPNPNDNIFSLEQGNNDQTVGSANIENLSGNINISLSQIADATGFQSEKITIGSDLKVNLIATAQNVPMKYWTWGNTDEQGLCHFLISWDREILKDERAFESFSLTEGTGFSRQMYSVVNQLVTESQEPLGVSSQVNSPIYNGKNRGLWIWKNTRHIVYDPFTDTVIYDKLYESEDVKEQRFDDNDPPQQIDDFYLNDRVLPDIIGKHHDHIDIVDAGPTQNTQFWNETDYGFVNAHANFVQPSVFPPESPQTNKYTFGPWYTNSEISPPLELILGTYSLVPGFDFTQDTVFTSTPLNPLTVRAIVPPETTGSPDSTGEANGVFLLPWRTS